MPQKQGSSCVCTASRARGSGDASVSKALGRFSTDLLGRIRGLMCVRSVGGFVHREVACLSWAIYPVSLVPLPSISSRGLRQQWHDTKTVYDILLPGMPYASSMRRFRLSASALSCVSKRDMPLVTETDGPRKLCTSPRLNELVCLSPPANGWRVAEAV